MFPVLFQTFRKTFFVCGHYRTGFRLVLLCLILFKKSYCSFAPNFYKVPRLPITVPTLLCTVSGFLTTVPRLFGTLPVLLVSFPRPFGIVPVLLVSVRRLFGTVPVLLVSVPRPLSQEYCPKTTVPRLSQEYCPKGSVPRLVSQDYCPKTTVPRLLSQD